jgi:hypothetical protein
MTLNYHIIVESYFSPSQGLEFLSIFYLSGELSKPNGVVGGSIPGHESVSHLTENQPGGKKTPHVLEKKMNSSKNF